ncbi:hypothetical protein J6590_009664, partial [Homalodisca vitripennis]
ESEDNCLFRLPSLSLSTSPCVRFKVVPLKKFTRAPSEEVPGRNRTDIPFHQKQAYPRNKRTLPQFPGLIFAHLIETGICARLGLVRSSIDSAIYAHFTLLDQGLTWMASDPYRH